MAAISTALPVNTIEGAFRRVSRHSWRYFYTVHVCCMNMQGDARVMKGLCPWCWSLRA